MYKFGRTLTPFLPTAPNMVINFLYLVTFRIIG